MSVNHNNKAQFKYLLDKMQDNEDILEDEEYDMYNDSTFGVSLEKMDSKGKFDYKIKLMMIRI